MLGRPLSNEYEPYFETYIQIVPQGNLLLILSQQIKETADLLRNITDAQGEYRYASGKWSLKEVIGHMADTERIMAYRLLRIARGDETPLAGFDENQFVKAAAFGQRSVQDLVEELTSVRQATLYLLHGLTNEAWLCAGIANNKNVTVRSIAYIIAGHELHHRKVIEERYLSQND
jgi:uncharacterized damage-inducible protein DinB